MANTDGGFEPVTFVKTDDRGDHELLASSPSDVVRLTYDGWREKDAKAKPARSRTTTTTTGPTAG